MQSCFHDYCQLDGVAMRPPLGPTLADIFLCHFEKDRFSDWQQDFHLKFAGGIVDDTFVKSNL